MNPFEMVIALAGLILAGFIFAKIVGLIKAWINRSNNDIPEEAFDRLAKAFIHYRKETERRIENLETIILENEGASDTDINEERLNDSSKSIELEEGGTQDDSNKASEGNNLRNMLRD